MAIIGGEGSVSVEEDGGVWPKKFNREMGEKGGAVVVMRWVFFFGTIGDGEGMIRSGQ